MNSDEASTPTPAPGSPVTEAALARGWDHRHRDVSGGWLRPTVFGAVDGLVTNASLIAGVHGGGVSAHAIVLTGLAGLVAGAFSMGTGEYVSVTNQNELVHAEVAVERTMHARFPDAERVELTETFAGYGADPETAAKMAAAVSADPATALRFHTREELGVDADDLPSPVLAGTASLAGVLPRGAAAAAALPGRRPGPAPLPWPSPRSPWLSAEWSSAGSPAVGCCAPGSASCCWARWPWS